MNPNLSRWPLLWIRYYCLMAVFFDFFAHLFILILITNQHYGRMTWDEHIYFTLDSLVGVFFRISKTLARCGSFIFLHIIRSMKKYLVIAVLAAIGIFNAFYLSIPAYKYWNGADSAALQMMPCDLSDKLSCSGILQNKRAIIFEIPLGNTDDAKFMDCSPPGTCWRKTFKVAFPMIAAVVYPVLFLIALYGYFRKGYGAAKLLTGLAAGGMMFNAYVIYQEFIVWVFCPLCAMCTVIIISIAILSMTIWWRPKVEKSAEESIIATSSR